ncbi:MAG TPA: tripartite tricarboxylate transporter substrate binding protein [Burkholderiales bacterium]|nr:tripartite tricarboxylate transporter substrate binding protein [Burkholderiales bacterium]
MTILLRRCGPLLALLLASAAAAQTYPAKPIRVVVPYAVGGATDVVLRIVAPRWGEYLGQQVVVDNRPGGGSVIGLDLVAKSAPDGYTVGVANIAFGANPSLLSKLPYDTEKDFVPVSLVTTVPMVLAVHPSVPARSVKDLIAVAKAKPGSLSFASAGNASANHLANELFDYLAGVKMVHVPYKGGGPAVIAIVSGEVAVLFATIPSSLQHFKSGRLHGLAISTANRNSTLPEIPTIAESGLPGYEAFDWQGIVLPAGTPGAIGLRLQKELARALAQPEVHERMVANGAEVVGSTAEELSAHFKKEFSKWSKVIKEAGIRLD